MNFRDGSLSSFPTSVDQFQIKTPFPSPPSDLERASHFNHYFDASLQLQRASRFGISGPVLGGLSGSPALTKDLLLGSVVVSRQVPAGAATVVATGSVPLGFGPSPFQDPAFAVGITSTVVPEGLPAHPVAEGLDTPVGLYNDLADLPQVVTSFKPTGSHTFELHHRILSPVSESMGGTSSGFSDDFVRPNSPSLGTRWVEYERKSSYGDIASRSFEIVGNSLRIQRHYRSGDRWYGGGGFAFPSSHSNPSTDHSLEFRLLEVTTPPNRNKLMLGPAVRFRFRETPPTLRPYERIYSVSGYVFALSVSSSSYMAQLVRLDGVNLSPKEIPSTADWSGSYSLLGSPVTLPVSAMSSPDGLRLKMEADGPNIVVSQSLNGGVSWTTVASAVDATYLTGRVGFCTSPAPSGSSATWRVHVGDAHIQTQSDLSNFTVRSEVLMAKVGGPVQTQVG